MSITLIFTPCQWKSINMAMAVIKSHNELKRMKMIFLTKSSIEHEHFGCVSSSCLLYCARHRTKHHSAVKTNVGHNMPVTLRLGKRDEHLKRKTLGCRVASSAEQQPLIKRVVPPLQPTLDGRPQRGWSAIGRHGSRIGAAGACGHGLRCRASGCANTPRGGCRGGAGGSTSSADFGASFIRVKPHSWLDIAGRYCTTRFGSRSWSLLPTAITNIRVFAEVKVCVRPLPKRKGRRRRRWRGCFNHLEPKHGDKHRRGAGMHFVSTLVMDLLLSPCSHTNPEDA